MSDDAANPWNEALAELTAEMTSESQGPTHVPNETQAQPSLNENQVSSLDPAPEQDSWEAALRRASLGSLPETIPETLWDDVKKSDTVSRKTRDFNRSSILNMHYRGSGVFKSMQTMNQPQPPAAKKRTSIKAKSSNFWSRLATSPDAWDETEIEQVQRAECQPGGFHPDTYYSPTWVCSVAFKNKRIILSSLITFILLTGAGLAIVFTEAHKFKAAVHEDTIILAWDSADWFKDEIDKALTPLLALEQFVRNTDDDFRSLHTQIADAPYEPRSLYIKDVTGICDNSRYTDPFTVIAKSIQNGILPNSLVSLHLSPYAVTCLQYPHYTHGDNVHSSPGIDLLAEEQYSDLTATTINAPDTAFLYGPTPVTFNETLTVNEALVATYTVQVNGYEIPIGNVDFPAWGIASSVIDWNKWISQIRLYDTFYDRHLEFRITGSQSQVIAHSENSHRLTPSTSITLTLPSTNNQWTIVTGYDPSQIRPYWLGWMTAVVVVGSAIIAFMLLIVLVEIHEQRSLLYYLIPTKFISRLKRKEVVIEKYENCTIFVAQIIGFSALTGQMMPTEVLTLLNQLYDKFDRLVMKYNLVKVETMGDTYVVIGAGPEYCSSSVEGAEKVALFSLDVVDFVSRFKAEDGISVYVRAGIASGQIVAGVIGSISTFPKYSVFGDTFNYASLLQSTCKKMKIQCSDSAHKLLSESPRFNFVFRERMDGAALPSNETVIPDSSSKTWYLNAVKSK